MDWRWDSHFLNLCAGISDMSKDPNTRVGAVIVGPDREIRCTGFNGFPRGIADDARLAERDQKLKIVVHAEQNCICNAARVGVSLRDCTLYLAATDDTGAVWGGPPCSRCTVHVIQAGITTIVSRPQKAVPSRWHEDLALAGQLIEEAGIIYREVLHAWDQ